MIVLAELPAILLVFSIVDCKKFGRKNIIMFGYFVLALTLLGIYFGKGHFLIFGLSCLKFWGRFISLIAAPMVAESYSTVLRAMGLGVGGALARIISASAPFIVYSIFLKDHFLPYLIFGICYFLSLIVMYSFPVDLTGQNLDDKVIVESKKSDVL